MGPEACAGSMLRGEEGHALPGRVSDNHVFADHPAATLPFALYFALQSCQFLYGKHCREFVCTETIEQRVFRICSLAICGYRVTTTVKRPTCNAMR